ncbi:acetoin utilization AcuB family protein [Pseudalkalibacillus caeni]|uniref:CBS domain-containing protein n=1 Tax=Exobacillus caeni TaxID=2574798 RepID=A0A5R9FA39_9BACL|nr:acetoin utilization AcuB family protein [Pseudalkalibacillus caeni]TLS39086.1 CBS domain-containing protein [Pseudalkalibacillus caeni]
MIIEEIMNRNVHTMYADQTIADALTLLNRQKIRHIPIVNKEEELVGIISDRDVRDASPSTLDLDPDKALLDSPVSSIMEPDVITAHPLDFVEEISAVFYEQRIGCVPIVEKGRVVGIVTESDMLHTLILLTGAHQPSSHIEIQVENVSGKLAEITSIISKRKVNIISVLVYPNNDDKYKNLVFRVQTMNPMGIIQDITDHGHKVLWPNMPGVTE